MLTACGGGGGGDSGGGSGGGGSKISLASIDAYFPSFDETNLTVGEIRSNKEYEPVSATKISSFITYLTTNSFVMSGGGIYTKSNVATGVNARVEIDTDDIELYLISTSTTHDEHNDALFATVYGTIEADVVNVHRRKNYTSDATSNFNNYAALLQSKGMNCHKSIGWDCEKWVNGLEYSWETYGNSAEWSVDK